jgi:4-amino-4-deoxy-L-arabinose transferase-like glycosyltransferase
VRTTRVALAAICVLALVLRVDEAADDGGQPPDATAYAQLAENLSDGDGYGFDPADPTTPPQPASTYSPGLPLVVSGIYAVTGTDETLARIILALIGAAAVPLTFLLGRRLAGDGAGLAAALVLAVLPAVTEYAGLLLTEPLASTLLVGALLAILRASDDSDWHWAAGGGALLGLLTLVRAEFLVLVFLLGVLVVFRRPGAWRAAALPAAAVVLAGILVIAPWTIRNASALDRFVPVSTGGGKTLYIGTNLEADGDAVKLRADLLARYPHTAEQLARQGPLDDPSTYALERLLNEVADEEDPSARTDEVLGRLGRKQLTDATTDHPGQLLGLLAGKTYDTWTKPARETMDLLPWRILQFALIFGALTGLVLLAIRRRFEALVLGGVLLFITAVGAVLIASPRRALTALPLVCALAAAGFTLAGAAVQERLAERSTRP